VPRPALLVVVLAAAGTLALPGVAAASGAVTAAADQFSIGAGAGSDSDSDLANGVDSFSGNVSATAPENPSATASAEMDASVANGTDSATVNGNGNMMCSQPAGGAGAGADNLFDSTIGVSAPSGVAYSASLSGSGDTVQMRLVDESTDQPVFNLSTTGSLSPSGTLGPGEYSLHIQINCSITPNTAAATKNASYSISAQFGTSSAPAVTIVNGPSGTVPTRDARFEFTTTNPSPPQGRFECRVDGQGAAAFTPCSSPVDLIGLADGDHFFEVRYHPDGEGPGPAAGRHWTVDTTCDDVKVGFALAQGCFTETQPGSGIFETESQAWVGGFEVRPRPGGKLVLNTGAPSVAASGTGANVVFAGFTVPIDVADIPVGTASGSIALLGGGGTVGGVLDLPIEGSAKASWASNGAAANFEAEVKVGDLTKKIGGLVALSASQSIKKPQGKLKARLENGVGFVLQQGEVSVDEIAVIPKSLVVPRTLALKNLLLRFALRDGKPLWTGRAGIGLPLTRGDLDVTGTVFVFDGSIAGGGLEVDGINKRVLGPIFLQKVGGDLLFVPKFGYDVRVGGTLGPKVKGKKLVTIDGKAQGGSLLSSGCTAGSDPTKLESVAKLGPLEGLVQAGLAKVDITTRNCIYTGAGTAIEGIIQGDISFLNNAFGYRGTQTGFVSVNGASYEGAVRLRLPGRSDLNGSAIVSTQGLAACANAGRFDVGFAYEWGAGPPSPFTGCDLAPYRVAVSAAQLGRAAATLRLPRGLQHVAFAASATGDAPQLKVAGPGGAQGAQTFPVPQESTTYVLVDNPRAGTWRIDPVDPSVQLTRVRVARGLPKPHVKARLGRSGRKLRLRYAVTPLPGQRVRFLERGEGVGTVLGKARSRRGTISFQPTASARRARTIEAEVTQDGAPRALITVARFKAPPPKRPGRTRPRATRKRSTLDVRWKAVRGADRYLVEVRKGRETLERILTRKRRLQLRGMPPKGTLRVSVQALSDIVRPGPAATVRVK
jgi:hypothetical protein